MIAHLGNYCVGLWVLLRLRLVNFTIRVDYKNFAKELAYILELKKQFGKVREFGMKNRKPLSEDLKFSESELI